MKNSECFPGYRVDFSRCKVNRFLNGPCELDILGLPIRIRNRLNSASILGCGDFISTEYGKIGSLYFLSDAELGRVRQVGVCAVKTLRDKLEAFKKELVFINERGLTNITFKLC